MMNPFEARHEPKHSAGDYENVSVNRGTCQLIWEGQKDDQVTSMQHLILQPFCWGYHYQCRDFAFRSTMVVGVHIEGVNVPDI